MVKGNDHQISIHLGHFLYTSIQINTEKREKTEVLYQPFHFQVRKKNARERERKKNENNSKLVRLMSKIHENRNEAAPTPSITPPPPLPVAGGHVIMYVVLTVRYALRCQRTKVLLDSASIKTFPRIGQNKNRCL